MSVFLILPLISTIRHKFIEKNDRRHLNKHIDISFDHNLLAFLDGEMHATFTRHLTIIHFGKENSLFSLVRPSNNNQQ